MIGGHFTLKLSVSCRLVQACRPENEFIRRCNGQFPDYYPCTFNDNPTTSNSPDLNKLEWKEVHALFRQQLEQGPRDLTPPYGCQRFHRQRFQIPATLREVTVSTVYISDQTYVTGISFISSEGLVTLVGYTVKGDEPRTNVTEQRVAVGKIEGFILAVGLSGIHALQVVAGGRQLSQWSGHPDDVPKTRRLVIGKPIVALEAGFDVRPTCTTLSTP